MLIVEEGLAQAKTATKALFGDHHCLRSLSSESCSIFSPPTITSFPPGDELLQLFCHVPTTQLNLDLLNNHPTVGEIAVQASVVPSKCKSISLSLLIPPPYLMAKMASVCEETHNF